MNWMRRVSKRHVLAGVLILSVVSCLARPRGFGWPRELLAPVLAPLSYTGTYVAAGVRRNVHEWAAGEMDEETARRLLAEHPSLRRELLDRVDGRLRQQLHRYEWLLARKDERVARLAGMTGFRGHFPCMLIPATVIAHSPMPYEAGRLVWPGRRVSEGNLVTTRELLTYRPTAVPDNRAVLSNTSLVGQIVSSGAWTAHLQLITDPDFQVRAWVERVYDKSKDPADQRIIEVIETVGGKLVPARRPLRQRDELWIPVNLRGQGTGRLTTEPLPRRHGIAVGDLVLTTGTGVDPDHGDSRLPEGVMIGRVAEVLPVSDNPQHVRLSIEPEADLEALHEVYIVEPQPTRRR